MVYLKDERSHLYYRLCERVFVSHAAITSVSTVMKDSILVFGTEEGKVGTYHLKDATTQYIERQFEKVGGLLIRKKNVEGKLMV